MRPEKISQSDHDLLIGLDVKVDTLSTYFTNHLKHHYAYTIALFTALLSVITGFVLFLLKS